MKIGKKIFCRIYQVCFWIAIPFLPYRVPKQLERMEDIISLLREKKIDSVLLVIDGGVRRLGLTKGLEERLETSQIHAEIYEQNTPNPTVANVESARECYLKGNAKAIIAIGGGSAMDCAKICGARIAKPKKTVSDLKGILKIWKKTPLFIAVPTTAGTGSEVTLAAVITDDQTHHKYPINSFPLIPDYAVLDPGLTTGLPAGITSTTGLDALTHAVEAYIGRSTTAFTRKMSVEAVRLIFDYLETAVENGQDEAARKNMLKAAFCAGLAFSRSYVGYVHGIAHSLGGKYGIAHGLANAVILPVMLREYGTTCEKKLAKLGRECGLVSGDISDREAAELFIVRIEGMNEKFGLPKGFPELKKADIPEMAGYADKESNPLYPVPKLMDAKELARIYEMFVVAE